MSELPPVFPVTSTAQEAPGTAIPTREQFANRYAGMRANRERAAAELGGLAIAEQPMADPYGIEASVEGGDINELRLAIGGLLVDVGQKIEDEALITDAETIFGVTPETMAAAEHARLNAQPVPSSEAPIDLNEYRNSRTTRRSKSKRSGNGPQNRSSSHTGPKNRSHGRRSHSVSRDRQDA